MVQLSMLAAAGILALFGRGFVGNIIKRPPATRGDTEKTMKKEGTMQASGAVKIDPDFDAEFNALLKELNAVDVDAEKELTTLQSSTE